MSSLPLSTKRLPLLWLLGAILLSARSLTATTSHRASADHLDGYYVASHPTFTIGLPAIFCLFAGIYFALGATAVFRVRPILGYAHLAVTLVGAALMQFPIMALRLAPVRTRYDDPSAAFAVGNQMAAIGYVLSLASLLLFAYVLFDGWRRAKVQLGG